MHALLLLGESVLKRRMAIKLTNLLFLSLVVATRFSSSSSDETRSNSSNDESNNIGKLNKCTKCQDICDTCHDLRKNKCIRR